MASPSDPPPLGKPSVETALAIIDQKLRGGTLAFENLRKRDDELATALGVVQERLRPKPTNWFGVVMSLFGAFATILTTVWVLSWLFSERPTREEIARDTAVHKQQIDTITSEQRYLRDQQIEQRTVLKGLSDTLIETNKKLDYLIQRGTGRGAGTGRSTTP